MWLFVCVLLGFKFHVHTKYFKMLEMKMLYFERYSVFADTPEGDGAICYRILQHKDDVNDGATDSGKPLR